MDIDRLFKVGEIYTPSSPIEIRDLFSGRLEQFQKANSIIPQKGFHAIIYGDRGVGKTSFSNILRAVFKSPARQVEKVSCSSEDTLASLWRTILGKFVIKYEDVKERVSFVKDPEIVESMINLGSCLPKEDDKVKPQMVIDLLAEIPNSIIIIDEFDRLDDSIFNKKAFTDIIKAISDNIPSTTLILVGVSEDITTLIQEHASIERNLGQIHMPVMSTDEIKEIIEKGEEPLDITFEQKVSEKIVQLSSGYPHFAHSLCYHAAYATILQDEDIVTESHLQVAIKQTIDNAHESLRNSYRTATLATKANTFAEVLLAASIVETDEYGYFQANDLEPILTEILGTETKVQNFVYHLGKFCLEERGEILKVTGSKNRQRYKFKNPLLKAFVRLKIENEKTLAAGKKVGKGRQS